MKFHPRSSSVTAGATLVESVIAVGVLAVAVPLVFGAIAEAGKGGQSARAETRAPWITRYCMEEIQASRDGQPRYFTATSTGQAFPPSGDVWAIAFSSDGRPVGKMSKSIYERGTKELNGQTISYIAVVSAVPETPAVNATPMLKSRVTIEYPAIAGFKKRSKLDFHTRIP
jgi:Tfp pilus assembly protein PilV